MDESELALKTAELALSKSRGELYSDLIKIGIPSLVAIAGIVGTYLLTKASHTKDLKIENLRASRGTQKEVNDRTWELIKDITLELSNLNKTMLRYSTSLSAKMGTERDGQTLPEEIKEELLKRYQDFVDIIHESFSIEAKVMLLGRRNIDEKFSDYLKELSRLLTNLNPLVGPDRIGELDQRLYTIRNLHEALIQSLSAVFLLEEQTKSGSDTVSPVK